MIFHVCLKEIGLCRNFRYKIFQQKLFSAKWAKMIRRRIKFAPYLLVVPDPKNFNLLETIKSSPLCKFWWVAAELCWDMNPIYSLKEPEGFHMGLWKLNPSPFQQFLSNVTVVFFFTQHLQNICFVQKNSAAISSQSHHIVYRDTIKTPSII